MLSLHNIHRNLVYTRLTPILFLSIFITTALFAQTDLLLKIPETSDNQIRILKARFNIKLRYRTQNFSIIEAYHSTLPELPSVKILDSISSGFDYFVVLPTSTQDTLEG